MMFQVDQVKNKNLKIRKWKNISNKRNVKSFKKFINKSNFFKINFLKDSDYEEFKNTCSIYFDFKNGDSIHYYEKDINQVAGLRIFCHGLCLSTIDLLPQELQDKIEELLKLKVFTVSNILELIGEVYHELIGNNEIIIPLLIIMDEMQLTIPEFSKENPKRYKEIAKSVGFYCYNQHGINKRGLKDRLCIIPVLAGTDNDLGFPLSDHNNIQFPLPPLSKEGIFSILKYKNISATWYKNKEKIRFWHSIGMIPKSLEYGINAIEKLNSNQFH
jgi:hypothetical protein